MPPETVRERVRTAYDAIASAFAARHAAMPPDLIRLGHALLDRLDRPGPLLDAGCGAGRDMAWFEAQGVAVVGLDLSAGMLAAARRRARGSLVQGDLCALPFGDGHFHAVWCMAALLHLPKAVVPAALHELKRVLRPGGLLALSLQEGEEEVWQVDPFGVGVERFFSRYGVEEVEGLLARTGFTPIELDTPAEAHGWLQFLASVGGARPS